MTEKWEYSQFKNPLARAKGLGAARGGLHHWVHQKITAVANIPLVLWGVWSAMTLAAAGGRIDAVQGFFGQPCNAVLMVLFLVSVFYHMALGLQVVIEDYVHTEAAKIILLLSVKMACFAAFVVGAFSVLKMAL